MGFLTGNAAQDIGNSISNMIKYAYALFNLQTKISLKESAFKHTCICFNTFLNFSLLFKTVLLEQLNYGNIETLFIRFKSTKQTVIIFLQETVLFLPADLLQRHLLYRIYRI